MARASALVLTAVLLLIGVQAAHATAPPRYSPGPASGSLASLVAATGADARGAAGARHAHLRKLESQLQDLAAAELRGHDLRATAERKGLTLTRDRVWVDVYVDGDVERAADALRDLGMQVAAVSDHAPQRLVEGWLPAAALTEAAGLRRTRAIAAVLGSGVNTGSVLSEGDAAHHGPQARALGPTGAGVTVGLVSDSIDRVGGGVSDSQASGDLPGPASSPPGQVQVLRDGDAASSDEGRAMAEIVFDGAPGVRNLLFSTGQGAAVRAAGIDNLVAAGATVIADDIFQITEPFFQDGIVAQAADRAKAAGVTYLVSAGNRGRQSWEGTYAPVPDPRGVSPDSEDFDPGAAVDTVQRLGTFTNRNMFVSLQWDEPWTAAETNLALDLYTFSGDTPVYEFTIDSDNVATGLPREFAGIAVTGTVAVGIAIRRVAGPRTPFMKYIVGGTQTFTIAEHNDPSVGAIDPDASSARGALTVGAVEASDPGNDTPEGFSSRGPTKRFFDVAGNRLATPEVRAKPELAGADGVATSVPGFNPFFGTSAAAPSLAGVAALIRSANPALPVDGVAAILTNTANTIDCTETAGLPDLDCGFGFPLADSAVTQALDATPPAVTPNVAPAATGAGGFFTGDVAVSWSVSDDGSPVYATSGCGPVTIATDGVSTPTCTASSAGGSSTQSVTVKRDASPPSAPAITGIAARAYASTALPPAAGIGCTAGDPTSGVASCTVSGYSAAAGAHTLTATATNGAGLTSTATLAYSVTIAAPALSGLSVRGRTLRYRLSEPARVVFTVDRCVPRKGSRTKCRRFVRVGRFTQAGKVGSNTKKVPAKVGGKRLRPARYRVTLRATSASGKRSAPKRLTLRIARR